MPSEQDKAMIRRDIAFIRERDKYTLRQPERARDAAVWLLTQGLHSTPARVIYTLRGKPPYAVSVPHPTDHMTFLVLHVCERDLVVVFEASPVNDGWALWRPGVTTRETPDMSSRRCPASHLEVEAAICQWLETARAKQAQDAIQRAREGVRHG